MNHLVILYLSVNLQIDDILNSSKGYRYFKNKSIIKKYKADDKARNVISFDFRQQDDLISSIESKEGKLSPFGYVV